MVQNAVSDLYLFLSEKTTQRSYLLILSDASRGLLVHPSHIALKPNKKCQQQQPLPATPCQQRHRSVFFRAEQFQFSTWLSFQ
jgi:hypothetical protein